METSYNAADFLAGLFGSPITEAKLAPNLKYAPDIAAEAVGFSKEGGPPVEAALAAQVQRANRRRFAKPASGGDWPADVAALADFALLLSVDDLPTAPFEFGPAETVVDAAKFLRWLQADTRRGPNGPRAMYGALQSDLRRLLQCIGLCETSPKQKDEAQR